MLSLLIPCFNYNVYPLAFELSEQCKSCGIEYEIVALDDGSSIHFPANEEINELDNSRFLTNEQNAGRAFTINRLVDLAAFKYFLILEADAFPCDKNYIQLYVDAITQNPQAVFGGVTYSEKKPAENAMLRWIYGNARESKDLKYRLKNPSDIVFSWNLLIKKSLFSKPLFDVSITTYGFEDLVFLKKLKESGIAIQQIENPLMHQNEEDSTVFIDKSKTATLNLITLYQNKTLSAKDSSLLSAFETVKKLHLTGTVTQFFKRFEKTLNKNLKSEKPSLFLFDLYRLGYFCQQFQLKNKRK